MKYFPDEPARSMWARYAVAVLPLLFLIVALLYSASSAPWGRQVDPGTTYAMNGIAWADDGLMRRTITRAPRPSCWSGSWSSCGQVSPAPQTSSKSD